MRTLLLSSTFFFCGCSLVGLDDFDIPQCIDSSACARLNERLMIGPDDCMRYQCSQGRCELGNRDDDDDGFAAIACGGDDCDDAAPMPMTGDPGGSTSFPGGSEMCDGRDNNCNGTIDDAVTAGPASTPVVEGVASPEYVRYGRSITSGIGVATKIASGAFFNVHPRDTEVTMTTAQPVGVSRSMDLGSGGFANAVLAMGCPSQSGTRTPPPTTTVSAMPCRMAGGTCCNTVGATDAEKHEACWGAEGNYCNGYETCEPNSPASDALTGCRATMAGADPCTAGSTCNEASDLCTTVNMASCTLGDFAAVEFVERQWFAAALNVSGCAAGQLRVGYLTENMASIDGSDPGRNLLLRGDERRSTSYLGIDLAENGCTGGSRGGELGAARPAIAMLPPTAARHRPQALVAWIGAPAARGTMTSPAAAADVEIVGIWHEIGGAGGVDVGWVNATNNGVAQRFDEATIGVAAPAVAAVTEGRAGYVVGYGQEGGGIALRFVRAFDDPPDVSAMNPFRTTVTVSSPPRTTMPIADLGTATIVPGATGATMPVDFVRVAVGRADGNDITLGVSWLEGGRVYFAPVTLDAMTGAFTAGNALAVSEMGARDPAIAYTPAGLRLEGNFGGTMVSATETGGFVVTWTAGGMIQAARFAETDATGVAAEPLDGNAVSLGASGTAAQPTGPVSAEAPYPRVLYHDGSAVQITAGVCGPAI